MLINLFTSILKCYIFNMRVGYAVTYPTLAKPTVSELIMPIENIRNKSLKLRIYPNKSQEILINKTFGCCRLIYNLHLEERLKFYESNNLKDIKDKNERIKILKTFKPKTEKEWKEKYPFMKEVSANSLQQSRINCDNAFNNFFSKRTGFPKFKSKKNNHQSYRDCSIYNTFLRKFHYHKIEIPKLGFVNFKQKTLPRWFSQIKSFKSITVEKTPSGKYFAVCLFEIEPIVYPTQNRKDSIGLDFSPELLYVDSDGNTGKDFGYVPQKQKNIKILRKYQRQLARKTKGSNNYRKARIKLARVEEYIANCRRDFIEKETLRLVRSYDKVVVEDLNLIGIFKFLRNAKNMNDASWGAFVTRLENKGKDYNSNIIKANRYFPSSQLCSNCGYQYHELKLSERKWTCPSCGQVHIRDVNAAINLKNYVPKELRESMPVKGIEELAELALQVSEYPLKQETNS